MGFLEFFWLMLISFLFISYLIVLFQIITDLFRDHELSGGFKALWVLGLLIFPVLTALVYLIARGPGMARRQTAAVERAKAQTDAYIREVAKTSPAEDIAHARKLLDDGVINAEEYDRLKAKALA